MNKKLTSANEKQEATIVSLKKVCGRVPLYLKLSEARCHHILSNIFNCESHKRLLLLKFASHC